MEKKKQIKFKDLSLPLKFGALISIGLGIVYSISLLVIVVKLITS